MFVLSFLFIITVFLLQISRWWASTEWTVSHDCIQYTHNRICGMRLATSSQRVNTHAWQANCRGPFKGECKHVPNRLIKQRVRYRRPAISLTQWQHQKSKSDIAVRVCYQHLFLISPLVVDWTIIFQQQNPFCRLATTKKMSPFKLLAFTSYVSEQRLMWLKGNWCCPFFLTAFITRITCMDVLVGKGTYKEQYRKVIYHPWDGSSASTSGQTFCVSVSVCVRYKR